jgi:hypothetical protein
MIGGFVISNSVATADSTPAPLRVAFRGLGPSVGVGVQRLEDPTIELYDSSGTSIGHNDDWAGDMSAAEIIASGLAPADSREAAMIRTLSPGAYTLVVRPKSGSASGVGLMEIYELSNATNEERRLINLSTRCLVGTGDNVPVAGMIIGERTPDGHAVNDESVPDRRMLVMGRGPSLGVAPYNLADALPDPQLELAQVDDSNSPTGTTIIGTNDNWKTIDDDSPTTIPVEQRVALEEELQAASYAPSNVLESILWPTLRPGAYTTVLSGSSNTTGVGIIELYEY